LKKEVFYISGNHDLFYGLEDLKKELTNFIFMDNETFKINYKNEIINNLELLNENQIKYIYHLTEAEKIKER